MKFLVTVLALLIAAPTLAQMPDLIFSEYVEGSSYNKALEIYNGTDGSVTLADYSLEIYANGATTPTVISLGNSTLAAQEVFVVANPAASSAILGVTDLTSGALSFNGDDAVVLVGGGQPVDHIGQVGNDPGAGWSCVSGSTVNTTIRRMIGVCNGDNAVSDPFDPCVEYDFFPNDTFDGLGHHTDDCHSVSAPGTTWAGLKAQFR